MSSNIFCLYQFTNQYTFLNRIRILKIAEEKKPHINEGINFIIQNYY